MNQTKSTFQQNNPAPKPKTYRAPTNLIEALKEAGSDIAKNTVKGVTTDLIGGVANQAMDTLFSGGSSQPSADQNNQEFNFQEYMQTSEQREQMIRQQQMVSYEYQQSETVIFNRRQEETQQKIQQIQVEIKQLAQAIVGLDQSFQSAVSQEIVDPGTYHLTFFEKLLTYIRLLRKKVTESRHWASMQSQRSGAKSYFWNQSNNKVSGTKFMLSSERSVVTQTG